MLSQKLPFYGIQIGNKYNETDLQTKLKHKREKERNNFNIYLLTYKKLSISNAYQIYINCRLSNVK